MTAIIGASAADLAGLPGMPASKKAVKRLAKQLAWPFYRRHGGGLQGCKLFDVRSLPVETRDAFCGRRPGLTHDGRTVSTNFHGAGESAETKADLAGRVGGAVSAAAPSFNGPVEHAHIVGQVHIHFNGLPPHHGIDADAREVSAASQLGSGSTVASSFNERVESVYIARDVHLAESNRQAKRGPQSVAGARPTKRNRKTA